MAGSAVRHHGNPGSVQTTLERMALCSLPGWANDRSDARLNPVPRPTPQGMLVIMARSPSGFSYIRVGDQIVINHHRRQATILRGAAMARFLSDVENRDPQQLMARVTGNYKHGNERASRDNPRRQGRRPGAANR